MSFLLNLLAFIIALGLIVFIHELGHFSVAKIFGLYVIEFSLGFGPVLFCKKGKETRYCIRAIPLGGFVKVFGEEDDKITPDEDEFNIDPELYKGRTVNDINTLKKLLFTLAGVIMNFLLALAIMSSLLLSYKEITGEIGTTIDTIIEGKPASEADILPGDTIVAIESHDIKTNIKNHDDLTLYMASYDGTDDLTLYLKRGDNNIETTLKPTYEDGSYLIGVSFKMPEPIKVTIWNCVPLGASKLWSLAKAVLNSLKGLFRGIGAEQVGGPVAIYEATSEAVQMGFDSYLYIIMVLSLNIGVVNLLPLPALDGGRSLIYFIEGIVGKKLPKNVENILMSVSFALIMLLFILVMFKDVMGLF